jgi:hypothetical protein
MIDTELLVSSWLRSNGADRTYVDTIPDDPVWPLVRLTLIDATPSRRTTAEWLEKHWLQVDVYGDTKVQAVDLKNQVITALRNILGVHTDGVVTGVDLTWRSLADVSYRPPRPRYIVSAHLSVHP